MTGTPITVVDLFAGAGGLSAGLHQASPRFQIIAAAELDKAAAASYAATFGREGVYQGDIAEWLTSDKMPSSVDLVVGGPPCQGFSALGKQQVNDARNELWLHYAETVHKLTPKYFVLENVPAFTKSPQYEQFVNSTKPGGLLQDYAFEMRILNAADYGVPQIRKRTIIIGYRRDLGAPGFPQPTHSDDPKAGLLPYVTVAEALDGVPFEPDSPLPTGGDSDKAPRSPRQTHWARNYTDLSMKRFREIPKGGNRFNLPEHLQAPCWKRHKTGSADVMGRLRWDRPSVTIRTEFYKPEKGRYIHPEADRAITHYEAALLQGFNGDHLFIGSRTEVGRQIGNAVPIPLGKAIGVFLAKRM